MRNTDSDKKSDQTKYFKSLIKSGYTEKLVESGSSDTFVEMPEDTDETVEVSDDIRTKALVLLGLIEEYFVRPENESNEIQELNELANENNLAILLTKLKKDRETPGNNEPVNVKDSIKQQIQLLLATKGVKDYFFGILKQETEYFQTAKPTLQRIALLQRLKEKIASGITRFYLRDKRSKGKLMATTARTIGELEEKKVEADREEGRLKANADTQTQSWLMVQELLEYKKQLRETGFAKTKSRKDLIEHVLSDIAHDNKVFLVGSTGTGKTQLAMLVSELVNKKGFEIVSWHEGTTPRDLFGYREVWQDEGGIKSGTKKGPVTIAVTDGHIVIHDEYTVGSTRAQLSAKAQMNARVGKKTKIPGFGGEVFTVKEGYGEVFTGNLKDERTKAREDMDPAVLRMLSGIKVTFMPANELFKIILAELIDDTGLLPLSSTEVMLIKRLTQASELMQMCHDREINKLEQLEHKDSIKQIFGGRIEEVRLDKCFLDTGTLLRMFKGWDLKRARGQKFSTFLKDQLDCFIDDPKFDIDKEERKLAKTILETCGVLDEALPHTEIPPKPYIPPSKIGTLFNEMIDEDIIDDEDRDLDEDLEKMIDSQYDSALTLLETSGLYNPSERTHPSKTHVKKLLAQNISSDQLKVINQIQNPVLQLVPKLTCEEYETALNKNKPMILNNSALHGNAVITDWVRNAFGRANTRDNAEAHITGWRVVITEGADAPTLLPGDSINRNLKERYEWFKNNFENKGISGIDIKSYMLLQIAGFAKSTPRPVDDYQESDETWTMLNAEEIFENLIVSGSFFNAICRIRLSERSINFRYNVARFRTSVMIDVPKTG